MAARLLQLLLLLPVLLLERVVVRAALRGGGHMWPQEFSNESHNSYKKHTLQTLWSVHDRISVIAPVGCRETSAEECGDGAAGEWSGSDVCCSIMRPIPPQHSIIFL